MSRTVTCGPTDHTICWLWGGPKRWPRSVERNPTQAYMRSIFRGSGSSRKYTFPMSSFLRIQVQVWLRYNMWLNSWWTEISSFRTTWMSYCLINAWDVKPIWQLLDYLDKTWVGAFPQTAVKFKRWPQFLAKKKLKIAYISKVGGTILFLCQK